MPENRKGTGQKAADTIRLKYTPEQIAAQKAAGGSVSTPGGFGYMKKHDPERFRQIIAEREARRKAKQHKPFLTADDLPKSQFKLGKPSKFKKSRRGASFNGKHND